MNMNWWRYVALGVVAAAVGLIVGLAVQSTPSRPTVSGLNTAQLGDEKLRQEIRQLQLSNDESSGVQHDLLAWAPFVTALGAIVAVGATLWKQTTDLAAARTQLRDDHDKLRVANEQWQERFLEDQHTNRLQQEAESLRRFDASLTSTITNLGSQSESLQVNAAAALATYLKPRYSAFHADLLVVVAANLQLRPSAAVARVLGSDLERLLRLLYASDAAGRGELPAEIDLARAPLPRLDVSDIDFEPTVLDVAFADLSKARLTGANLFRLRGQQADLTGAYCSRARLGEARLNEAILQKAVLHEADLVSATLKRADLSGAQLQQARLQEAHLEGAKLTGADFTGADVANAYFRGALFDEQALRTIALGAKRWRDNNNFDAPVRATLEQIAGPAAT
jgi:uncharacterized protein YjbI with pentapeptide repeats